MSLAKQKIKCPYCHEAINAGSTKCKHCLSELPKKESRFKTILNRYNTFRMGFLTGVLFTIILGLIIYLQISLNK